MKIIKTKQLAADLGLSPVTIWRMEKDGLLPRKIQISKRAVGWLESDIQNWMDGKKCPETVPVKSSSALPKTQNRR